MKKILVFSSMLFLLMAGTSLAVPITGTPVGNSFGWVAPSTNALNYDKLTPGYIGDLTPYVVFNTNDSGSVTLDFYNGYAGGAFFEYMTDDVVIGTTAHPIVTGDVIRPGIWLAAGTASSLGEVFSATNYVDVRLALGGEGDWRFDWVRFEVAPTSVPEPATILLFGTGLIGLAAGGRKKFFKK